MAYTPEGAQERFEQVIVPHMINNMTDLLTEYAVANASAHRDEPDVKYWWGDLVSDLRGEVIYAHFHESSRPKWAVEWDENDRPTEWAFDGMTYFNLFYLDYTPLALAALEMLPKDDPFRVAVEEMEDTTNE